MRVSVDDELNRSTDEVQRRRRTGQRDGIGRREEQFAYRDRRKNRELTDRRLQQ